MKKKKKNIKYPSRHDLPSQRTERSNVRMACRDKARKGIIGDRDASDEFLTETGLLLKHPGF